MDNIEHPPFGKITQEEIEKVALEAKASQAMILEWSEKQGRQIIRQMELRKHPLTLGRVWFEVRKGWLGGFMSGVQAGFQLGYKAAHKLTEGFVNGIDAVVQGTEVEAIKRRNKELKNILNGAISDASGCWKKPEMAGDYDFAKAEAIVAKLYERFSTPVPPAPAPKGPSLVVAPESNQERLPGL